MKRMRVKSIMAVAAAVCLAAVPACSAKPDKQAETAQEEIRTEAQTETEAPESDEQAAGTQEAEIPAEDSEQNGEDSSQSGTEELTFADLSGYTYTFSSGAGAWATELMIEKDGYFHGLYSDGEMGDMGEGYENGTVIYSEFSGHFSDLKRTGDTTWEMKLADISYQNPVGEERIDVFDEIRYVYTDAYGISGSDTFHIYWKGTPVSALSEDVSFWVMWDIDSKEYLEHPVIADQVDELAFSSAERQKPYEEAKQELDVYQSSYDALGEKMQELTSQGDMNLCAGKMYENSDRCLNRIWNLVRYNTDENKFDKILEEQRKWIAEKEAEKQRITNDWDGGSGKDLDLYTVLADMTMKRCRELVGYLEENRPF